MTQESFEEKIIQQYNNKILSRDEINSICKQAIKEGVICKEDLKQISGCTTIELLNNLKKWNSAFLHKSINLNSSSESEFETIRDELENSVVNKSCFYTPNRNGDGSFISQLYNSPVNTNYIKQNEIENPFCSPFKTPLNKNSGKENNFLFESFCEDLNKKTQSIKKTASDQTAKEVKKLIDNFIKYTEKKAPINTKKGRFRLYFFIFLLVIVLIFLYTPQPF